jgi:hypothetical protein
MRLSSTLNPLIEASSSRPQPTPASPGARDIFSKAEREAAARGLGLSPWLAILTATMMTMNSLETMLALYQ